MMQVVSALFLFGTIAVVYALVGSAVLNQRGRASRLGSPLDVLERKVNGHTLVYCHGCGCNHRLMWMKWHDQCAFRCIVCCGDDDHVDQMLRWR